MEYSELSSSYRSHHPPASRPRYLFPFPAVISPSLPHHPDYHPTYLAPTTRPILPSSHPICLSPFTYLIDGDSVTRLQHTYSASSPFHDDMSSLCVSAPTLETMSFRFSVAQQRGRVGCFEHPRAILIFASHCIAFQRVAESSWVWNLPVLEGVEWRVGVCVSCGTNLQHKHADMSRLQSHFSSPGSHHDCDPRPSLTARGQVQAPRLRTSNPHAQWVCAKHMRAGVIQMADSDRRWGSSTRCDRDSDGCECVVPASRYCFSPLLGALSLTLFWAVSLGTLARSRTS